MTSKQLRSQANIFFICLICLGITFTSAFAQDVSAATEPSSTQIIDRFEIIKNKMAKLRFCYNESCFYRNVTSKVISPTNKSKVVRL